MCSTKHLRVLITCSAFCKVPWAKGCLEGRARVRHNCKNKYFALALKKVTTDRRAWGNACNQKKVVLLKAKWYGRNVTTCGVKARLEIQDWAFGSVKVFLFTCSDWPVHRAKTMWKSLSHTFESDRVLELCSLLLKIASLSLHFRKYLYYANCSPLGMWAGLGVAGLEIMGSLSHCLSSMDTSTLPEPLR